MNGKIDSRYHINEETSLHFLKKRWEKRSYTEVLAILEKSKIYPFMRDEWVTTPCGNIEEYKEEKYEDEGYEFTYFEAILKDNAIFTEIDKKQYVSCSMCNPVELDPFEVEGIHQGKTKPELMFDCSYTRSKGSVPDTDIVLINQAEGDFATCLSYGVKHILFDGDDIKRFEEQDLGVGQGKHDQDKHPQPPYLDKESEFYSVELDIAIQAHKAVVVDKWRGGHRRIGHTENLAEWVKEKYPDSSQAMVERMKSMANPKTEYPKSRKKTEISTLP